MINRDLIFIIIVFIHFLSKKDLWNLQLNLTHVPPNFIHVTVNICLIFFFFFNLIPDLFPNASYYLSHLFLGDGYGWRSGGTWSPPIVLSNYHPRPSCTNTASMIWSPYGRVKYVVTTLGDKLTLCHLFFQWVLHKAQNSHRSSYI